MYVRNVAKNYARECARKVERNYASMDAKK